MDNDFKRRAIIIPVIISLFLAVAFSVYISVNGDSIVPVRYDAVMAYYEKKVENPTISDKTEGFEKNDCVAVIEAEKEIPVLYEADYVNLENSASLKSKGSAFSNGITFVEVSSALKDGVSKNSLKIKTKDNTHSYTFVEDRDFTSENDVLSYSTRAKNSVVIYFRQNNGVGLSSNYKAYVFSEVSV